MTTIPILLLLGVGTAVSDGQGPPAPAFAQETVKPSPSIAELQALTVRTPQEPRAWVLLGLAYLDRNEKANALSAFERAVRVGPNSAEAHNWLGVALADKADLPAAVAEFRKAVALDPEYGRAYSNLGSALAQSGDYGEAVQVFGKALALEPNSTGAQFNLGIALRETGEFKAALGYLRRVASAEPANAGYQYELGQALRQSGDLPAAAATFEKALAIDPELREAYYALGVTLKQQGANRREPAASSPGPADDLYKRAEQEVASGQLAAARDHLTEALRLDERHAEAHNLLGFALGQHGDLAAAIAHLERAIALRPGSASAHYNLGVALWYSGSREKAVSELRESVKLDPAAGASQAFLGTALREQGDLEGARVSLQRALALMPEAAAVYVDLGITYLRAGRLENALGQLEASLTLPAPLAPEPDWDSAIGGLRQALKATAGAAEAYNVLGLLLGRRGTDSREVSAAFREAIRLRPEFAAAHNNLGLVLLQAGDDDGGIAALREAIRLRPDYAEAHTNLGAALTPTDAAEAVRELEKAVALAPDSVKAQFNLAVAYGASPQAGREREIEHLRTVIALDPTFARAHLALGKAFLQDAKVVDAVRELQEAARLDPASGEAHYQLGLALARSGRKDEAAAELTTGRELVSAADRRQNASLDIAEGRAAMERGELEQAAAALRRAIQLLPDSPDAHRYLGAALEKMGDRAGAATAYRAALDLNPGDVSLKERLDSLTSAAPDGEDPARVAEFEGYIREGRYAEVEPRLAAFVKERPASSWGWYALGYTLFAQQKIGESIRALAKSLELDIKNAEAHKILGRDLMIVGRFDAAQLEFEQAIHYKPDSAESHYNLGKLLSIQDDWAPARKAFEAALRIDPGYVEAIDALGLALEALGDDAGAVERYQQAIALNDARHGRFAAAHVNLSAYYNRTGEPGKALDYARKALELDRSSDRALFQKARALERQGHLEESAGALNEAIVLNPRASSYYYVLAGVYRRLGMMDENRKALETFKRLERESNELEKKRRAAAQSASPGTSSESKRD